MGLLARLFRRKSPSVVSIQSAFGMIDRDQLLARLDPVADQLNVPRESHVLMKLSAFLIYGTDVAYASAGSAQIDSSTGFNECNALVIFLHQGIHTFLTIMHPKGSENSEAYRTEFTNIFAFTMAKVFHYEPDMLDDRSRGIVNAGTTANRRIQAENGMLVRQISADWQTFFNDTSDETVAAMGQSYQMALNWLNKRPMG